MTPARLAAAEVRKYFVDAPDPAVLHQAEAGLRAAEELLSRSSDLSAIHKRRQTERGLFLGGAGLCLVLLIPASGGSFIPLALLSPFLTMGFIALVVCAFVVPQNRARRAEEAARQSVLAAEYARGQWSAVRDDYYRQLSLAEPKPSDSQMDLTLIHDIAGLRSRAMRSLALVPQDLVRPSRPGSPDDLDWSPFNSNNPQDPFIVYGPAYGEGFPVSSAMGADGRRRYGRYSIMVICTTRYHLAVYRCVLDFFTGQLNSESTVEMHYQDVVSVRTHSDPDSGRRIIVEPRPSQRHLFPPGTERYFELVVSSGTTLRMVTGLNNREAAAFRRSGAEGLVHQGGEPDFQAVADAVRMMLREKKGGVDGPELVP
ncbi:hypothetical protein [Streptomyces sp. TP-A0874]|uniref:hypothetical protein n=1 Tax=Streptomyces sp. TP-A0874 TaxID=549819 RepID=UPI0008529BDB|nr:hypothetical protein [Streptomyces sp. TP-A0874]